MSRTNPPKSPSVQATPEESETEALSSEQRHDLVDKAVGGGITAGETELLADDIARATKKAHLAAAQTAHPNDPEFAVYAGPASRAESATASLSQMTPVLIGMAAKYKRDRHRSAIAGGKKKQEAAAPQQKRVVDAALRLRQDGILDRKLVSEMKDKYEFSLTDKQLRTILRAGGVLPPPKKGK